MTLSEELKWRGLIQDTTLEDAALLDKKDLWTFYIGFDASAPSQTIGNLASMMVVKTFLRHGHKAIILAGGATSLIGDPGGKDKERDFLISEDNVANNIENAFKQFKTIFRDEEGQITYVNNLSWYKDFKLLDFLRDTGKNFSMTPLIQRDFIASRLGEGGSGISYAEFSYTLLQGYDYLKLFEEYQCELQLGGSDQWGNCLSGVDLIRRRHGVNTHVLTWPLIINKATGRKFGKTEAGAIWLDDHLTHPSDFYQFWLNTNDQDAIDYLKIFTPLKAEVINEIAQKHSLNPSKRLAQNELAQNITQLVHGLKNLQLSQLFSQLAFKKLIQIPESTSKILSSLSLKQQIIVQESLDQTLDDLVNKTPLIESRAQIKQLLSNQAVKIVLENKGQLSFQTPKTLTEMQAALFNENQKAILIVLGKNTIRSLKY